MLINFLNLSTILVQGSLTSYTFIFNPSPNHFIDILVSQNTYLLFKFILTAIELTRRLKYDMLQEVMFCTFAARIKFILKVVSN